MLVTSIGVVEDILLGAARLGLTGGQRAFIHLDTRRALNATSHLAMSVPFTSRSSAATNHSGTDRLMTAAQSLLIVKAHAVSLADEAITTYKVCHLASIGALFIGSFYSQVKSSCL